MPLYKDYLLVKGEPVWLIKPITHKGIEPLIFPYRIALTFELYVTY